MQDLAGKVAVVTGGGGGIGRALGERFLAEGMRVVLADIDEPLLDATAAELGARHDDVVGVVTDVSLPESVEHLRDATLERFGSVHLVCNNAGIPSGSDGALWEHHVNDWRWAVDVNVFGVINGINTFVPVLLEQGGPGHVVNTSSSNGTFAPLSNSAVYATHQGRGHQHHGMPLGPDAVGRPPGPGVVAAPVDPHARRARHRYLATRAQPARPLRATGAGARRGSRRAHAVRGAARAARAGADVRTTRGGGRHRARRDPDRPVLDLPPGREVGRDHQRGAASMRDAAPPEYLIAPSPWNVPKT